MKLSTKIAVFTLPTLLLMGCNSSNADKDGDGKVSEEELKAEVEKSGIGKLKAGQWEMSMKMSELDAPGMPKELQEMMKSQLGKEQKMKTCVTKEQAEKPSAEFFGGNKDKCTITKMERDGSKITTEMKCDMGNNIAMMGKTMGEFSDSSYKMSIDQQISGAKPEEKMSMKGEISGKYLGECPAEPAAPAVTMPPKAPAAPVKAAPPSAK
ncbi:hypothetical protein LPB140_01865 [Sphingorhabdus lutea]|uniref:EF-hand domain-containing protein n=1 Tax=Sphingorhabdus lutea TaxID=1913578 RepID=A0A1L3J9J4_9SPHN|nr:DUF3617 domain-containing protein [Sphingorhabdus lutea]APG61781.1 hypothetical protein LPB140_01865 [Sphingorhabdus lutea]